MMLALLLLLTSVEAFSPRIHGESECREFMCGSGRCIPVTWECDDEVDCEDGSDEHQGCSEHVCIPPEFQCEPGACIPEAWLCDGQKDCFNGLDEGNCSVTCSTIEFMCKSTKSCIQKVWVCDGDNDCVDGSDEESCPSNECTGDEFRCADKHCIPKSWKCDGDVDCPDNSDEEDCPNQHLKPTSICQRNEYLCNNRFSCIPNEWLCDGAFDCPDGDDETHDTCLLKTSCRSDQYQCQSGQCIGGLLYCNGVADCSDQSDEENCTAAVILSCKDEEFDCGGGMCIDRSNVCNGKSDCPNGEDEPAGKCHVNECLINNGGCPDVCIDTPIGHECTCRPGYKLSHNLTCQDINECDNPGSCSHKCINEDGAFKCECFEGYSKEPHDKTRCKPTEGRTHLLFTRKHDIRRLSADHHQMTAIVNNTKSATALDFIYKSGMIFWSDFHEHKIYKAPIDEGNIQTVVISNEITNCDGLAVDWIYNHIYWTDTGKNTIEVANLDGSMKKALFSNNLDEPRAIAVNPLDGWLYWSDWGVEGRIERAGMDGSHRQVIVSFDIKWPNGITLDLVRQKLYWVDAKLNMISSVNYDGSDRRVVLRSSDTLHHPFSISVFEDYVYWTDWERQAIFRANKFSGANVSSVTDEVKLQNLMVVHTYHPYRQPNGTNHCIMGTTRCSHLCLPSPQIHENAPKISCACPDNYVLGADGLSCRAEETLKSGNEKERHQILQQYSQNRDMTEEEYYKKTIIPIVVISISLFLLFTSVVAYFIYRNYLEKTITSINFDNPVYRKTTEDRFSLVQVHHENSIHTKNDTTEDIPTT